VARPILGATGHMKEGDADVHTSTSLMRSDDYVMLGKQALQRLDNKSAIANFEKAIDQDPNSCEAHYSLGLAYHNQSLHNKSISEYEKAIALEQSFAPPYKGLAEVYEEKKDMKGAISYYEDYSKLILNRKDIEETREKINLLQAQTREQEDKIKRADELFRTGKEHYAQKRYDDAISELQRCITIDPNHQESQKYLEMAQNQKEKKRQKDIQECYVKGEGYLKNQNYSQATYCFSEVLKLAPDHADAKRQLESAKENIRRQQEKERLQQAEKKQRIAEHFSNGIASFNREEYSQAIFHFRNVLKLDPNHNDAQQYLEFAQLKKMEEKLENKTVDIIVDAKGDAKLPEGW